MGEYFWDRDESAGYCYPASLFRWFPVIKEPTICAEELSFHIPGGNLAVLRGRHSLIVNAVQRVLPLGPCPVP